MKEIFKLRGQAKDDFYQSKYDYYKKFNMWTLVASCFVFIILFSVDWVLYQYFEWGAILRRSVVLIPLFVFIILYLKIDNYKVMSVVSFSLVYTITGCSIWVNSYLPDSSHASEGFLVICFILLLVSFSTPPGYAFIFQWGCVTGIILSKTTVNYEAYDVMVTYLCQVTILLCIVDYIVTKVYYDQYITKNKLEWALVHDPLTQVYNRNKLNNMMGVGHDLSYISENISILIIDIDHFKKVNDIYGHNSGDYILQFIAENIKESLRKKDVVVRWGGEEFVVIMPDCNLKQAYVIAERLRKRIETVENGVCAVTISIGLARYSGGDCIETIKRADKALYRAKQEGRNKVECHSQ